MIASAASNEIAQKTGSANRDDGVVDVRAFSPFGEFSNESWFFAERTFSNGRLMALFEKSLDCFSIEALGE